MRHWGPWSVAALLTLVATLAVAQSPADALVQQLRDQGYVEFEVSRTLLGRIRIVAQAPDGAQREIVFNRATGEILRDYSEEADGGVVPQILDRSDRGARPEVVGQPSERGSSGEHRHPEGGNGDAPGRSGGNPGQGHGN